MLCIGVNFNEVHQAYKRAVAYSINFIYDYKSIVKNMYVMTTPFSMEHLNTDLNGRVLLCFCNGNIYE